jgi:uncharacterized protein YndB with AHSA1/START domain
LDGSRRKVDGVPVVELILQRTIDLPPVIVWDALVDPDLLAGWLGEVRPLAEGATAVHPDRTSRPPCAFELHGFEPHGFELNGFELHGFEILWPGANVGQSTTGTVSALEAPRLLRVDTDNRGRIEFTLVSIAGGLRGSSTELELRVDSGIEPAFATTVRDEWQTSLDRLERLLHGHPVDWANLATQSDGTTLVGGTSGRSVNSPHCP